MTGLRPIAEIMFSDFLAVCWDMVANEIAKTRYMTERADLPAARHPHRERRGLALRGAALAGGGKLGDGDPGAESRRALHARRCEGAASQRRCATRTR
jgi:hypothetical protein